MYLYIAHRVWFQHPTIPRAPYPALNLPLIHDYEFLDKHMHVYYLFFMYIYNIYFVINIIGDAFSSLG